MYSQTGEGYYSTISYVLGVPEKCFICPIYQKHIYLPLNIMGSPLFFSLRIVFVLLFFFKEVLVQVKLACTHFRVLETQHEYHQNITKMLVLLPLASSHNCIHTIFQIIGNQEQSY